MKSIILLTLMLPALAWAWGKRGHQIVGETAAILVSSEPGAGFMKEKSFDFGYYANVPDFIWKRPASYQQEKNQHFMDLEIFDRGAKPSADIKDPLALTRYEFDKAYPEVKEEAGRAFWRVREMYAQLEALSKELRAMKDDAPVKDRHALQEKWLVLAGTMAHYIGDLGQPLHVSENYDGQMTGQKGIHHFFEEVVVDELYPSVLNNVYKQASAKWPAFKKKNAEKSVLDLLNQMTKNSFAQLKPVLAIDKRIGRVAKKSEAYRRIIEERLVDSSLVLAELYRRQVGWKFNNEKFYFFAGEPAFIAPPLKTN